MSNQRVQCPCGVVLETTPAMQGKTIKCGSCQQLLKLPSSAPAAPAQPLSPAPTQPAAPQAGFPDLPVPAHQNFPPAPGSSASKAFVPPAKKTKTQKRKSKKQMPLIFGVAAGGVLFLVGIITAFVVLSGDKDEGQQSLAVEEKTPPPASVPVGSIPKTPRTPQASAASTARNVPPRPTFRPEFPSGVQFSTARFQTSGVAGRTTMKIYLPPGDHSQASLGCVLVAPAGTNLLVGNSDDGGDYHDETLPYAEAGFATIQYSLDGAIPDLNSATVAQLVSAYGRFKAAEAGVANARAVIDFVTERLPEVDPNRIYVAGHSSAGTVALNVSTYIPDKVAGCLAYAACSDPESFHSELLADPAAKSLFPGVLEFDRKYSPKRNSSRIKCPVFVFQARGDRVTTFSENSVFVNAIKRTNSGVTFELINGGDHYSSMINQGIPSGIAWLKKIDQ